MSSSSSSSSSSLQHLIFLIVAALHFLPAAAAAAAASADSIKTNKFLDCSPRTFQCGEHVNYTISYPFRTPDMPEYCGHPKLQLACINRSNSSVVLLAINISGNEYHVQAIDYNKQLLNVSRLDLYSNDSSSCPRVLTEYTTSSSWIDLSLFNYTSFDYHVTVYVNCSNLAALFPDLTPIDCSLTNNSTRRGYSYYSLAPPPPIEFSDQNCSLIMEIPIYLVVLKYLETHVMDFVQAVRQGFELSWMAGQRWCDGCKHTGGVCGFDSTSPDSPTCFCPDGRITSDICLKAENKHVLEHVRSDTTCWEARSGRSALPNPT